MITHIPDPYVVGVINSSLVNFTYHVHKNFLSIVWFCCHVSDHAINTIFSHELSWPLILFFGMEICISTLVFWMFSGKKGSVRGHYYKLQMSFWYLAVVEPKSIVFSFVLVGQQYSGNFILVSHFHFEMFGVMTDIFLVTVFFLSAFAICAFSLCILYLSPISSFFGLHFQIEILNLYTN